MTDERTTAPQPPLNHPVITESVGRAAEAVLAGKHCESLAAEAIDLTVKLLREIARRTPEVLTYTDIEAFIMNELNPAKVMANKDRTSCYGLVALLAKARAARPEERAPQPQGSPLAWLVFTPNHPEGFDYLVFPNEYDANCEVANDPEEEAREVVPLYRTSAFSPLGTLCSKCGAPPDVGCSLSFRSQCGRQPQSHRSSTIGDSK